jgi:hypothetical protein
LVPGLASDLAKSLLREEVGVDVIVTGVDPNGDPRILTVPDFEDSGREVCCLVCHDRSGFLAVGSGADQFETLFMSSG